MYFPLKRGEVTGFSSSRPTARCHHPKPPCSHIEECHTGYYLGSLGESFGICRWDGWLRKWNYANLTALGVIMWSERRNWLKCDAKCLLFSSASSISHHTSHKDLSSFTIDLSEIHSGASLLVTTSALGAFGPWPYGLQLLYRGPPADAQALCAALKVCQEQWWSQGAASHWVSVRMSRYFMGKIDKLNNG